MNSSEPARILIVGEREWLVGHLTRLDKRIADLKAERGRVRHRLHLIEQREAERDPS